MSMTATKRLFAGLVVIAFVLAGCAELRVDVDVYKGPLANHEDVQMQQMASMAMGAKPLLIELRKQLLESTCKGKLYAIDVDQNQYIEESLLRNHCYDRKNRKFLFSDHALRVNSILSLYEGLESRRIAELISESENALKDYKNARNEFLGEMPANPIAKWGKFEKGLFPGLRKKMSWNIFAKNRDWSNLKSHPFADKDGIISSESHQRPIMKLISGYNSFFNTEDRHNNNLNRTIAFAHYSAYKLNKNITTPWKVYKDKKGHPDNIATGSNYFFTMLSNPTVVKEHAELLFPHDCKESKEFVREVIRVSRSFLKARKSLRRFVRANLSLLAISDKESIDIFKNREDKKKQIVELTARLINATQLQGLLKLSSKGVTPNYIDSLYQNLTTNQSTDANDILAWDQLPFSELLSDSLIKNPAENSSNLLLADTFFSNAAELEGFENISSSMLKLEFQLPLKRKYGLVQGPTWDYSQADSLIRQHTAFKTDLSQILSRGRLQDGLETLIEKYLNEAEGIRCSDLTCEEEKERLIDALVRFAEKVLFIANYSQLLSDADRSKKEKENIDKYTRVLQAVGNSILNQADELHQQSSYISRNKERWHVELNAMKQTFSRDASGVTSKLINILDEEKSAIEGVKRKNDASIVTLGKEIIEENEAYQNRKDELEKKEKNFGAAFTVLTGTVNLLSKLEETRKDIAGFNGTMTEVNGYMDKIEASFKSYSASEERGSAFNTELDNFRAELRTKIESASKEIEQFVAPTTFLPISSISRALMKKVTSLEKEPENIKETVNLIAKPASEIKFGDLFTNVTSMNVAFKDYSSTARCYVDIVSKKPLDRKTCISTADKAKGSMKEYIDKINKLAENVLEAIDKSGEKVQVKSAWVGLQIENIKGEKAKTRDKLTELEGRKEYFEKENKGLRPKIDDLAVAIRNIDKLRPSWVDKYGGSAVNATALLDEILAHFVTAKNNAPSEGTSIAELKTTYEILKNRKFNIISIGDMDNLDKDPRNALDQLISTLQYQYIQAVQANGEESPSAQKIAQSIQAAAMHRSGMVYIRPSLAYLRSSNPSTFLQDEYKPEIVCDDFGECFEEKNYLQELDESIDKQFWQNINNVRVKGAGNTNYVIAKDDIGNWYVKNYSADPKPIIDSAQNLAMFSLGNKMDMDLLGRLKGERAKAAGVAGANTNASDEADQKTALEKLMDNSKGNYDKKTNEDYTKLAEEFKDDKIASYVRTAWQKSDDIQNTDGYYTKLDRYISANDTILSDAGKKLNKAIPSKTKDVAHLKATRILDALSAIKRFHAAIVRDIATIDITETLIRELKAAEIDVEAKNSAYIKKQEELTAAEQELAEAKLERDALESGQERRAATRQVNKKAAKVTELKSTLETDKAKLEQSKSTQDGVSEKVSRARKAEAYAYKATTVVGKKLIMPFLERRKDIVDDYEQAVHNVGQVSGLN